LDADEKLLKLDFEQAAGGDTIAELNKPARKVENTVSNQNLEV
jgi:hypothetical protein